jgi:hypothetical protein
MWKFRRRSGIAGKMEKRAFQRVPEKIRVDLYYEHDSYEGTVTDLSQNGLHIETQIHPPFEADLEVVLILGDEVFELFGKVKRLENKSSSGMGVELTAPSEHYCRFVSTMIDYNQQRDLLA